DVGRCIQCPRASSYAERGADNTNAGSLSRSGVRAIPQLV
ncbi:MAG: hypothetical protein AVDCRST_MAG43-1271, partial [uncultured Thermomicrobiales bacterium]